MNEFDSFIQELLGNPNPKGNMFTGQFVKDQREDDYYKNPFRMQDSIDEAMRKKLAEEAAAKAAAAAQVEQTTSDGGSDSAPTQSVYGNYGADGLAPTTIGTGLMSGVISDDALTAAALGMNVGGPMGAMLGGLGAYSSGTQNMLDIANAQVDPLGFLATQQGWYSGRATPAPIVTADQLQAQQQRAAAQRAAEEQAAAQAAAAQAAAAQRAAAQAAANARANYESSSYQSYSPSGGGYTGMSDTNSNAGTSGSPSYGSGGFL